MRIPDTGTGWRGKGGTELVRRPPSPSRIGGNGAIGRIDGAETLAVFCGPMRKFPKIRRRCLRWLGRTPTALKRGDPGKNPSNLGTGSAYRYWTYSNKDGWSSRQNLSEHCIDRFVSVQVAT